MAHLETGCSSVPLDLTDPLVRTVRWHKVEIAAKSFNEDGADVNASAHSGDRSAFAVKVVLMQGNSTLELCKHYLLQGPEF